MKLLNDWLLKDNESAPDGTVEKTCSLCKCRFAVPEDEASDIPDDVICEACATPIVSDPEGNKEAENAIKKALGN